LHLDVGSSHSRVERDSKDSAVRRLIAVRELSSNRGDTGWFLSLVKYKIEDFTTVREDLITATSDVTVIKQIVSCLVKLRMKNF